eukprot:3235707-Lingulodinium_polyedra.AAC.1
MLPPLARPSAVAAGWAADAARPLPPAPMSAQALRLLHQVGPRASRRTAPPQPPQAPRWARAAWAPVLPGARLMVQAAQVLPPRAALAAPQFPRLPRPRQRHAPGHQRPAAQGRLG